MHLMSAPPRTSPEAQREPLAGQIAAALRAGRFDPQHAGELFLRADAERAIRAALGGSATIAMAGRDEGRVRAASFLGARFVPDLVVEVPGRGRVAVTITLLRSDPGPAAAALAGALVLATRYDAVVAFILDRRLGRPDPFGGPGDAAGAAGEAAPRALSEAERQLIEQLREGQRIWLEVRRQDPFGWE